MSVNRYSLYTAKARMFAAGVGFDQVLIGIMNQMVESIFVMLRSVPLDFPINERFVYVCVCVCVCARLCKREKECV